MRPARPPARRCRPRPRSPCSRPLLAGERRRRIRGNGLGACRGRDPFGLVGLVAEAPSAALELRHPPAMLGLASLPRPPLLRLTGGLFAGGLVDLRLLGLTPRCQVVTGRDEVPARLPEAEPGR